MAEKDVKVTCFLCGRDTKCVDAKAVDETLGGFAICPVNEGFQVDVQPEKK
jgi:hypothetical protein